MFILELLIIAFAIIALQLWHGNWSFFIAGYSGLSPEQKKNYNELELCRLVSKILVGCCIGLILIVIDIRFHTGFLIPTGMAITLISALGGSLLINVGKRLNHQDEAHAVLNKKGRNATILVAISGALLTIAIGFFFYYGNRQPIIDFTDGKMVVRALYGTKVPLSDIENVILIEESMETIDPGRRTNGYSGGDGNLRGHFEKGLLFVYASQAPTILIERSEDSDIYLSFKRIAHTKDLYDQLVKARENPDSIESDPAAPDGIITEEDESE